MTPSIVVRRDVYEALGGFDSRLICTEDWEMWVRIAAQYQIWYEVEPLALYRIHLDSNTGRHISSGAERHYTRQAIDIMKSYLPDEIAENVASEARKNYALGALDMAYTLLTERNISGAITQIKAAFKFSHALRVVWHFLRILVGTLIFWSQQIVTNRTNTVSPKTNGR
jgi:hypothetical protein